MEISYKQSTVVSKCLLREIGHFIFLFIGYDRLVYSMEKTHFFYNQQNHPFLSEMAILCIYIFEYGIQFCTFKIISPTNKFPVLSAVKNTTQKLVLKIS